MDSGKVIILQCYEGYPQPRDLIEALLIGTFIPVKEPCELEEGGRIKWDYSEIEQEMWDNAFPVIQFRITELYSRKLLKYGVIVN